MMKSGKKVVKSRNFAEELEREIEKEVGRVKKIAIIASGFILIALGFLELFLPGPGLPIIFAGILVLSGVFLWAKRLIRKIRRKIKNLEN